MNRAALLLLALAGAGACGKTTATPGDKLAEDDAVCAIPEHPSDVVIVVTRHVIPIGEIRVEEGQITATGQCSEKTECIHTDAATMERLLARVRGLGRVRHHGGHVSPHYGFRAITVRWAGEKCELADGVVAPIDDRDRDKFYVVWDALVDAITKSPEHVEPDAGGRPGDAP